VYTQCSLNGTKGKKKKSLSFLLHFAITVVFFPQTATPKMAIKPMTIQSTRWIFWNLLLLLADTYTRTGCFLVHVQTMIDWRRLMATRSMLLPSNRCLVRGAAIPDAGHVAPGALSCSTRCCHLSNPSIIRSIIAVLMLIAAGVKKNG
jgi:hypothetical protein